MSKNALDIVPALLAAAAKGDTATVAAVVASFTPDEVFAVNVRVAVVHATADGEPIVAAFLAQRVSALRPETVDA